MGAIALFPLTVGHTTALPDPTNPSPAIVAAIRTSLSPALAIIADHSRPVAERIQPLLDGEPVAPAAGDVAALRRILVDPGEEDTFRNEIANRLRAWEVAEVADDCWTVLGQLGEGARFRSFSAQHLGLVWVDGRSPRDGERLRSLLADRDVEVRREAILALARGADAEGLATARRWLLDPDPGLDPVRDVVLRIAGDQGWRDGIPAMRRDAAHASLLIRGAAIRALGTVRDPGSVEVLERATRDPDPQLALAAGWALERVRSASGAKVAP